MGVGESIKKYRLEKNISRQELAKKLGVNISTITRYENGIREPNIDTLIKIASIFRISTDLLLKKETLYDIGYIIKEEREELSLSLEELSKLSGIEKEKLEEYENDLIPIEENDFTSICEAFDTTQSEIFNKYCLYDEYIPKIFNGDVVKYEEFKKAVDFDNLSAAKENKLLASFNALNNIGQNEAIKRVDELTQINKYVNKNHIDTIAAHNEHLHEEGEIEKIYQDLDDMDNW
ncbi:TPA: helix-turn-helix transcriptional regulator [Clostridioides difficile]|uniref:helix-turn-helix domain-containing protein n=2 Tax=Clostridioides difficile TaxID=1496 RepID=UPI00038D7E00|nr:helix-turn-helix transcriptional regulator [Clostridioides difficile]EGT3815694.1 XRE family transcriptional regulator [Clostridioides difficile]EGT3826885.1 XRE family transcriptional regulator [Clostridioides difficile]EGT4251217.1 XRE family transcriptional regulator [Clostridioides difficile]EGT4637246.1 XRE family transcriptional regulator [Clostridioides difficile]EGT4710191.1 XRE family transcriptional regulator [Clostridioides difficile]